MTEDTRLIISLLQVTPAVESMGTNGESPIPKAKATYRQRRATYVWYWHRLSEVQALEFDSDVEDNPSRHGVFFALLQMNRVLLAYKPSSDTPNIRLKGTITTISVVAVDVPILNANVDENTSFTTVLTSIFLLFSSLR
ncbi:hypothetical protein AAHC03_0909 [Spirometra sp. Aus1]